MRTSLSRVLLTALVAAGALVVPPSAAYACSCADRTPPEYLRAADAVFTGRLVDAEVASRYERVLKFRVGRVFKGAVASYEKVSTGLNGASCGISTPQGARSLLIFADAITAKRGEPRYSANSCAGTAPASDYRPVHARFGPGAPPVVLRSPSTISPEGQPTDAVVAMTPEVRDTASVWPGLMAATLLALAGAVLAVLWRLRRPTGR